MKNLFKNKWARVSLILSSFILILLAICTCVALLVVSPYLEDKTDVEFYGEHAAEFYQNASQILNLPCQRNPELKDEFLIGTFKFSAFKYCIPQAVEIYTDSAQRRTSYVYTTDFNILQSIPYCSHDGAVHAVLGGGWYLCRGDLL